MKKFRNVVALLLCLVLTLSLGTANASAVDVSGNDSFKSISCNGVKEFPDGGKIYTYIINGVVNQFPVPPDGFDPVKATDEELERYGFPPRPKARSGNEYSSWLELVGDYTGTPLPDISIREKPITDIAITSSTKNSTASVTSIYSSNWSGYDSNLGSSSSNFYTQVQVDYTQPTISAISGSSSSNVIGYWVGLGGHNTQKLVQAGTATTGLSDHWAWYEYLSASHPNPAIRINSLTISPGDSIHVYIAFEKANDKFNYYIANNTTGKSASGIVNMDADEYFDGTTADWIVERASTYLPNYGSITMNTCKTTLNTSNTWLNIGNLTGIYKITLTSNGASSGTVLSQPGNISSNNTQFQCTWKAYS